MLECLQLVVLLQYHQLLTKDTNSFCTVPKLSNKAESKA